MIMNKSIYRKYKLFILQKRYTEISNNIFDLENHLNKLYNNNFISSINKNITLGKLFEISKSINTKYNNYINNKLDENLIKENFNSVIKKINFKDDEDLFNILKDYEKLNNKLIQPLELSHQQIIQLISENGCQSIKKMLKYAFNIPNNFIFSENIINLLNELEDIVVPLSYEFYQVKNNKNYYWRVPNKFNEYDLLELTREMWIKNPLNDNYLKINLIFKVDLLSVRIKTCQVNYPILYKLKNKLLKEFELNNVKIDNKFIKSYMRHDYLGNIYCLSSKKYFEQIKKSYYQKLELENTTFLNLMKDFIKKDNSTKNLFNTIFLLLLGNDESSDMSGLLIGLIKEKKNINNSFYYQIINNLTYYLQVKIKKSDISIKNQIEKLKSLTIDDIDYKKQLVTNKFIPENVKSLTLEKIEEMKTYNNEYFKQLTFVKNIMNFPWSNSNEEILFNKLNQNPNEAKKYLDDIKEKLKLSSYGHNEAKNLLLQIVGKWISNPKSQGTCFGLVGPPGVGKTLLAKSVSKALDIPFGQITLGGQNDGELLHGHGYTYSGSQPGMIIKKMVEMGKSKCILYFDELDKATSKHGSVNEITSILIHLTDPNMNKSFQDRFFQGIDFPLDKVIFMFSYNDSKLVDPILLDRIKEIKVDPYTLNDKLEICQNFIIPELLKSIGLDNENISLKNNILDFMINNYTNEAGVRGIKRIIEKLFLQINIDKINNTGLFKNKKKKNSITIEDVKKIISDNLAEDSKIHPNNEIGIINGLYATNNGDGGIIPIQIFKNFTSSNDKYEIKLTGSQGDVMKESVQCALTTALDYIRKNLKKYKFIKNLDDYLQKNFKYGFHVHAPSTSTPKDGPSAGGAFTTAFISRILDKKIKNYVGMTGEIELTGRITKIGGLTYKLFGAKRAGVKLVYIPNENKKDLKDIIEKNKKLIDKNFKVIPFENISEIIDDILE